VPSSRLTILEIGRKSMRCSLTPTGPDPGPAMVSASYSDAVFVERSSSNDHAVKIYPDPARTGFTIEFTLQEESAINISLVDLSGRLVGRSINNIYLKPGHGTVKMPVSDIASGVYIMRLNIRNTVCSRLVTIQ